MRSAHRWIEVAWDCCGVLPWVDVDDSVATDRFRERCERSLADVRRMRVNLNGRGLVAVLLMVVMLVTGQPARSQGASVVKDPFLWIQNEAQNSWTKISTMAKNHQDMVNHIQAVASWYKTAQIWYHMYDRVANGNINLMISSLLPTLTFESDHVPGAYEKSQGAVGTVTDTVTIRPIPPEDRRRELAQKFHVKIQSDFNLGDFFKGNPLDWFDVDSSTQYVLPNGQRVIRQPAQIEQAAKIDAALAYTMGMARMQIAPDTVSFSLRTIDSSLSESQRIKLQAAHDQLQWIAQTEGADSINYRNAMMDYTRALESYAQASGDDSLDRLNHKAVADRMGAEAKEFMEQVGREEKVVLESAARQAGQGENQKTIKDNYEKPKDINLMNFIDPSKASATPQGQFAMSLKEQSSLNAIYQELAEINKQAALRSIEQMKAQRLEEERRENVAMNKNADDANDAAISQQATADLVALVRRAAMDGSLRANFVVPNPIPGTPDIQWTDYNGNTYNTDLMDQVLEALRDGRMTIRGGNIVGTIVYMDPANQQANDRNIEQARTQILNQSAAQRRQIAHDTYNDLAAGIQKVPSRLIMGLQQGWARFWANWRAAGGRVFPSLPNA